eukprot:33160-Alexandrium_andersonii.AAC.1
MVADASGYGACELQCDDACQRARPLCSLWRVRAPWTRAARRTALLASASTARRCVRRPAACGA